MTTNTPETIPAEFAAPHLEDAYRRGWNHGHGIACHNVPTLGAKIWTEDLGRVTVDAETVREVHASNCFQAESNSRCYSPFEFTAAEFNQADTTDGEFDPDKEGTAEELWEAFEAGTADAIHADLETYTDEDYGIPAGELGHETDGDWVALAKDAGYDGSPGGEREWCIGNGLAPQ